MGKTIQVELSTDEDGFVSKECPACHRRFKIRHGEGSDKPLSFCPYCKHKGRNCWLTREQAAYLRAVASNHVLGPALDKLQRASGRYLQVKVNRPRTPSKPIEPSEALPLAHFACCNERVKHDGKESRLTCVICGTQQNL